MYIFRHSQENWNTTSKAFSGKNHFCRGRVYHKSLLLDLSGPQAWGEASGEHPKCPGRFTSNHCVEQRWTKCLIDPLCAVWRWAFIYVTPTPCLPNMFLISPCVGDLTTTPSTSVSASLALLKAEHSSDLLRSSWAALVPYALLLGLHLILSNSLHLPEDKKPLNLFF